MPRKKNGKRKCNGWEIHYQGYKGNTNFRNGASKETTIFLGESQGKLDADLLVKLGIVGSAEFASTTH